MKCKRFISLMVLPLLLLSSCGSTSGDIFKDHGGIDEFGYDETGDYKAAIQTFLDKIEQNFVDNEAKYKDLGFEYSIEGSQFDPLTNEAYDLKSREVAYHGKAINEEKHESNGKKYTNTTYVDATSNTEAKMYLVQDIKEVKTGKVTTGKYKTVESYVDENNPTFVESLYEEAKYTYFDYCGAIVSLFALLYSLSVDVNDGTVTYSSAYRVIEFKDGSKERLEGFGIKTYNESDDTYSGATILINEKGEFRQLINDQTIGSKSASSTVSFLPYDGEELKLVEVTDEFKDVTPEVFLNTHNAR